MTTHRTSTHLDSALHLLHRAGQCADELFASNMGQSDLTPRQYAVLACVSHNPDISQTGLVEQTGVDRSTLADIVRRLVKKGLLHRKRTRRDARMYAVRLTAKGQSALGAVKPVASRVDQRILSALKTDQRGDFIEALDRGVFEWIDVAEIGRVVANRVPGRQSDQDVTLFKSLGIGLEDIAVAIRVFQKAKAENVGKWIDM